MNEELLLEVTAGIAVITFNQSMMEGLASRVVPARTSVSKDWPDIF